jgi:hypothetical protein
MSTKERNTKLQSSIAVHEHSWDLLTAVVEMLVLQAEEVPDEPPVADLFDLIDWSIYLI